MNADDIRALLGEPPITLEHQVNEIITASLAELRTKLPENIAAKLPPPPVVQYDLEGTTAGQAWIGQNRIRLNLDLLLNPKYQHDMLTQTLPHEVAHLVTYGIWGSSVKPHGRQWAYIMNVLGKPAKRCHQYEVETARKHARPYAYECACSTHMLTTNRHNKILSGTAYKCAKCGTRLRRKEI